MLAETPSRRAIGRTPSPSALAKITLARRAKPCASVGARNHASSFARSASVTFNLAAMLASLAFRTRYCYFRDMTLAVTLLSRSMVSIAIHCISLMESTYGRPD